VLEDACEGKQHMGQITPQDDGIEDDGMETLYISDVLSKSNLLQFHGYTVLNIETSLHILQQRAANSLNPMRKVGRVRESTKTEDASKGGSVRMGGESEEVLTVVSEKRNRRPKVSTRRTVWRRALILKDDGTSYNFVSSSYLDRLRKMDGVVIMTKDAGRMKVNTATGKDVHRKVLADVQIRIGTYTYHA